MTQQPRRRRLEVEDIGDITVVNFVDRKILDEQNVQVLGEQPFSLAAELGPRRVLLHVRRPAARGGLSLCGIAKEIQEVFEITKLDKLFTIHKEEQAALQAF